MKQEVVTTTCDRCTTEVNKPTPRNFSGDRLLLPDRWLHVSGVSTAGVLFTVDLCPDCAPAVLAAAGAIKPRRGPAAISGESR